ncbi:hypothetical protein CR513_35048, partial [Mucuna pruriens]
MDNDSSWDESTLISEEDSSNDCSPDEGDLLMREKERAKKIQRKEKKKNGTGCPKEKNRIECPKDKNRIENPKERNGIKCPKKSEENESVEDKEGLIASRREITGRIQVVNAFGSENPAQEIIKSRQSLDDEVSGHNADTTFRSIDDGKRSLGLWTNSASLDAFNVIRRIQHLWTMSFGETTLGFVWTILEPFGCYMPFNGLLWTLGPLDDLYGQWNPLDD